MEHRSEQLGRLVQGDDPWDWYAQTGSAFASISDVIEQLRRGGQTEAADVLHSLGADADLLVAKIHRALAEAESNSRSGSR
jgi:hypothetical protein